MKSHRGIDDIDADIFCTSDTNIETTFVYSIDDFVESDVLYNNEGIRLFVRNDHWILSKQLPSGIAAPIKSILKR